MSVLQYNCRCEMLLPNQKRARGLSLKPANQSRGFRKNGQFRLSPPTNAHRSFCSTAQPGPRGAMVCGAGVEPLLGYDRFFAGVSDESAIAIVGARHVIAE